jgi:hypothetical protein
LKKDAECSEAIAFRFALFWGPLAEQENGGKKDPAQNHAEQRSKRKWCWTRHGMSILSAPRRLAFANESA